MWDLVYCNFKPGFTCHTTVIFGIMTNGSRVINTLASFHCFACRNVYQNDANNMLEMVNMVTVFCQKVPSFVFNPVLFKFRWVVIIVRKKYTSGPRYWNVPVLVNTGTFLVYQYCLKMWYLHSLERAGVIQKLTILEHKNGLVLSNTCVPVSGTWSILFP